MPFAQLKAVGSSTNARSASYDPLQAALWDNEKASHNLTSSQDDLATKLEQAIDAVESLGIEGCVEKLDSLKETMADLRSGISDLLKAVKGLTQALTKDRKSR